MRKILFGFLCLALACMFAFDGTARAQDERADVFGGYSYLNVDTNGLTSRQSVNGWEASISGTAYKWLGAEGDFSGYYKTYPIDLSGLGLGFSTINLDVKDFAFMAGPRIDIHPVFVHALVGVDHLSGSALDYSASQNSFASAFGGGLQVPVSPRWAIRVSADYVLTNHNIFGGPGTSYTQNNYRASAGVVFRFGGEGGTSTFVSHSNPPKSGSEQAPLLGITGYGRGDGVLVVSVQGVSPAAAAGIKPGDIIMAVDAQPVHSGYDIENAIAGSQTGTVRVMYFRSGVIQTEVNVKVR